MHEMENPLLIQIQKKREEMIACALNTGYTSKETLYCSHELDQLIYLYQSSGQKILREKPMVKNQFRQLFQILNRLKSTEGSFES